MCVCLLTYVQSITLVTYLWMWKFHHFNKGSWCYLTWLGHQVNLWMTLDNSQLLTEMNSGLQELVLFLLNEVSQNGSVKLLVHWLHVAIPQSKVTHSFTEVTKELLHIIWIVNVLNPCQPSCSFYSWSGSIPQLLHGVLSRYKEHSTIVILIVKFCV